MGQEQGEGSREKALCELVMPDLGVLLSCISQSGSEAILAWGLSEVGEDPQDRNKGLG